MPKLKTLLLLSIIFATGCSNTTTRTHPTLAEELLQIDSVVILPPVVEVSLIAFTGENERITEKEIALKQELYQIARDKLEAHGYEVIDFDLEARIEEDEEFAYVVSQVREGFEQAKKDLKHGSAISEKEANLIQTSVGEAVNMISEISGADAALLIRYVGYQKSEGQIAKDVGTSILVGVLTMGTVIPIQTTSGGLAEAALIDGVSGDVLWSDIRQGTLSANIAATMLTSMPDDIDPTALPTVEDNNVIPSPESLEPTPIVEAPSPPKTQS